MRNYLWNLTYTKYFFDNVHAFSLSIWSMYFLQSLTISTLVCYYWYYYYYNIFWASTYVTYQLQGKSFLFKSSLINFLLWWIGSFVNLHAIGLHCMSMNTLITRKLVNWGLPRYWNNGRQVLYLSCFVLQFIVDFLCIFRWFLSIVFRRLVA